MQDSKSSQKQNWPCGNCSNGERVYSSAEVSSLLKALSTLSLERISFILEGLALPPLTRRSSLSASVW